MTMYDVIAKALAEDQERLAKLPHREMHPEYLHTLFGGHEVLEECPGYGREPQVQESNYINRGMPDMRTEPRYSCGFCRMAVDAPGPVLKHSRYLDHADQNRSTVAAVALLLGLDRTSDGVIMAMVRAREAPVVTRDGRLAAAMLGLAEVLIRRDATEGVAREIENLTSLTLDGDEHPLFTEAGLYDRLGKGNARAVLAHVNDVRRAAGQ